jgi:hypothetical protein
MTMTNFALRQKLVGDVASVTLRVMDPFNTMRMGYVMDAGRFYQTSRRNFGARGRAPFCPWPKPWLTNGNSPGMSHRSSKHIPPLAAELDHRPEKRRGATGRRTSWPSHEPAARSVLLLPDDGFTLTPRVH